jgi:alkylated DNA repair dioxygenase AlkB
MQLSLKAGPPAFDPAFSRAVRAHFSGGAWVEHVRGWIDGHDALFAEIERAMTWRSEKRVMYERVVEVPRLLARVPEDGEGHPLIHEMARALSARYRAPFDAITLALYRDGSDSVAWHRDREHRDRERSIVCVATLGGARRFLVRPLGGGQSTAFAIAGGDLCVMGGSCQRTLEHSIPKIARADPRLAIMFRHRAPISGRAV